MTQRVADKLNITNINLVSVSSKRKPVPGPENAQVDIALEPSIDSWRENMISVLCNLFLKISDVDQQSEIMTIQAEYCVTYNVTAKIDKTPEAIKTLVGSANFNTWPFFRELVLRLVADSGLTPLLLPTLTEKKLRKLIRETSKLTEIP